MVEPMRKVPELAMDGVLVAWFACDPWVRMEGKAFDLSGRIVRQMSEALCRNGAGVENR